MDEDILVRSLPSASRLALAYAPAPVRLPTLALFALDARLAGILRHSREPMLAQLRLTWWRETLERDRAEWPRGEPLLTALGSWGGQHQVLAALVDGWEALTGPAPLPSEALQAMADGRGTAFAGLALAVHRPDEAEAARRLGTQWGLADLATRLGNPQERATASSLAQEQGDAPRISRRLRPLLVLRGLARQRLKSGDSGALIGSLAVLRAMRLGLLGF